MSPDRASPSLCYALIPMPELIRQVGGEDIAVSFGSAGRATLALMVWMAVWWLTEAVDVSATALLPIAVLPLVTAGAFPRPSEAIIAATAPYANQFIALFLGGFLLALSMERWGLHRRIALTTLRFVGTRPRNMVGGFMAITAVMSMWVSNTATTVMMLPIALSVIGVVKEHETESGSRRDNLPICLLLGIAYAASIGGIGTLIGTPPNVLLAGFLQTTYGLEITFVRWLGIGLPLVVVFLPLTWLLLTSVLYPLRREPLPGGDQLIRDELAALGRMSVGEWATFVVFMIAALSWIFRPLLIDITIGGHRPLGGLTDPGIAIIAGLLLFAIPVDLRTGQFVMSWEMTRRLPWGVLILFGGGLSLAAAVTRYGVADFIGGQAQFLGALPGVLIVIAVTAGVIFLTELTSNTATTATLLPILAGLAPSLGIDPLLLLIPAAIAASCAFMMPVATPPNAIVFGSGYLTIPQMCKAGFWLNLIGVALVTILAYAVILPLLAGT